MRIIKKALGKIVYGLTKVHRLILDGLVYVIETGVLLAKSFLKGCIVALGMGGCLLVFLLIGPLGAVFFRYPLIGLVLLVIILFPIIGALSVSFLSYFKTVSSQYLYNLSNYLQQPDKYKYHNYKYYKEAYRRAEREQARREYERRAQQQRMWEERFTQWQHYGGSRQGSTAANPYVDFKQKYERACQTLGVQVTADPSRIKLAYRKKAKMYHPDVNASSDATQKFQEINEAYEFLNEDNIRRYKNLKN